MPSCPIYHVKQGRFYGHPASLDWTDDWKTAGKKATDTDPPDLRRALVVSPYSSSSEASIPAISPPN